MAKSMTTGSPVRLILNFSLPLLLGNLFQQLYNIIDAAIVGKVLGSNALAAVGASSSVQFLVLGFCIGICSGFGVPVAQRFGAQSYDSLKNFVYNGALLTTGIGLTVTVLTAILCPGILHIMSTPDAIYQDAYHYLLIIFLGIPATLLYNYLAGILRAIGDSKTSFYFLVFSACLNVFLDLFCIIVLKWGVTGAGLATVASQGLSGLLCLIYIIRKVEVLHLEKKNRHLSRRRIGQLLYMGLPMGLQFSITAIGSMMIQSSNNGLGTVYVSAFTAGMRIKQFAMCPFDAIATAVSTFAGQNFGAGKHDRVRQSTRTAFMIAFTITIPLSLILFFWGKGFLYIFVDDVEVIDIGIQMIKFLAPFYCTYIAVEVFSGVLRGMGSALVPMLITLSGICLLRVGWILIVFPLHKTIETVETSYPITWITTSLLFLAYYTFYMRKHADEFRR